MALTDGPDAHRGLEQRQRLRRRASRAIGVLNAMPAARRPHMLAQELARLRIEQADEEVVPLHVDAAADPAGRRAVVGGLDFHAAIEVHGADAEAVVPKRLERERAERRLLLGKHRGDLAFRRAVDARVGPVRFPAIEIALAPPRATRSGARAAASSSRARRRLRLCPCDRDRRRDTAGRRRHSARAHRGRAD